MAVGDITIFEEAKAYLFSGGWQPTDDIKVAILNSATVPAASDATPSLGDYNEVGDAGSYVAGGVSLGNLGSMISESGGTVTFDSATNPSWAQNGANDSDAFWALVYNDTQAGDPAILFMELGGPVDMSVGSLTIEWNALGLFTLV